MGYDLAPIGRGVVVDVPPEPPEPPPGPSVRDGRGLVWNQAESAAFKHRLMYDLAIWEPVLAGWRGQLMNIKAVVGSGPGAQLNGAAWTAVKTLFVDRLLPLVNAGIVLCSRTRTHLNRYTQAERPLLDDGGHLNEAGLQSAVDMLEREILDLMHTWTGHDGWVTVLGVRYRRIEVNPALIIRALEQLRAEHRAVKAKLDELRQFAAAVTGLFDDDLVALATLTAGVASLRRGSLLVDGTYVSARGDHEGWLDRIAPNVTKSEGNLRPVFDESGAYGGNQMSLTWNWVVMSAQEQAVYAAIIRRYWPDLNDFQIRDVVYWMAAVGCGYMAATNTIMAHYADHPALFESLFGFPFYAPDGSVNFDLVFAELWCYVQAHRPGVDPTGATPDHMPGGLTPTRGGFLEGYLAEHGVKIVVSDSGDARAAPAAAIASYYELKKTGATVILCADPLYYHDATGKVIESREGYHAVTITGDGVDESGRVYWVISSWSREYRLYPDEYANGTFDLDRNGVIDTDTDGDGRLDYQGLRDGKVQTINVNQLFLIESVSFL